MDLATAQTNLDAATEKYQKANVKSYSIQTPNGLRMVTHFELDKLRGEMEYWQRIVDNLKSRGRRKYAVANFRNP